MQVILAASQLQQGLLRNAVCCRLDLGQEDRQTDRHTDGRTDRQRNRRIKRQTNRQKRDDRERQGSVEDRRKRRQACIACHQRRGARKPDLPLAWQALLFIVNLLAIVRTQVDLCVYEAWTSAWICRLGAPTPLRWGNPLVGKSGFRVEAGEVEH